MAPGRRLTVFDTATYSGPNLSVTLDAARHGRLAQWNPDVYGGVSHLGNIQAAPLYPLKWPFAWMEVHRAWLYLVALHTVLLAAGLFWLVRDRLRLAAPAGLVAVVTVVGSGAVMVRMLFFEQILVLAWAPWLLGTIDAAIGRPAPRSPAMGSGGDGRTGATRSRAVVALAAVTAATLMAGHPQIVYVLLPLAALWSAGRLLDAERATRSDPVTGRVADRRAYLAGVVRRAVPVAAGVAGGVLLAAPQLLPALDQARRSANAGGRTLATVSQPGFSVVLRRLPGTWLGDPFAAVHSVTSGGYENLSFVGVVATATAVVALSRAWRSPRRWTTIALGVTVAATMVAAVGPRLVFYRVAFDVIPGFDQARVPARWAIAAVVAVGVLAAEGVDRLLRTTGGRHGDIEARLRHGVSAALALALALAVFGPFERPPATTVVVWVALAAAVAAAQYVPARQQLLAVAALAVLAAGELGLAARNSATRQALDLDRSMTQLDTRTIEFLLERTGVPAARPETAAQAGKVFALTADRIDDLAYVIASLRPNANVLYHLPSPDGYDGGIQVTRRWADAFAPLAAGALQTDAPARNQLRLPLDPAAFADLGVRWLLVDSTTPAGATAAGGWGPPALVDGSLTVYENPAFRGTAWLGGGAVSELRRPRPEQLELTVDSPGGGTVVVTEQWDPGWSATVDGAPAEVVPVDALATGIAVPSGTHTVVLRYRAAHLRLGLVLAGLSLVALVAGAPLTRAARRRLGRRGRG
ncbi:MAG: hypothetical protein AB7Q92_04900 [Acidimicrobiia bacterium]